MLQEGEGGGSRVDPGEIVTASQKRGSIGCDCSTAWSEEVKKRKWGHGNLKVVLGDGQEKIMKGFFVDK